MSYELKKNDHGDVWFIKKAGSAYVKGTMPYGKVVGIIEAASDISKSDKFDDFEIVVNNGEYFFAGNIVSEEKPADEPKPEDKPDQGKGSDNFKKDKWQK